MQKNKPLEIQYISDLTGSGKSEHVVDKICTSDEKFLLVAPKRALCDELYSRIFPNTDDVCQNIHQNTFTDPVNRLKRIFKDSNDPTRVVITTHASFLSVLNRDLDMSEWNLILDEEMPVFKEHEVNVTSHTKQIIEETLTFEAKDDLFSRVVCKSPAFGMNLITGNVKDTFLNNRPFVDLIMDIMDSKYDTLVSRDMLAEFRERELDPNGTKFSKFYAMSIINLDVLKGFKSILTLCSFFEKTITYKLLKNLDCVLKPYPFVPMFKHHTNTDKITIHYFFNTNWSTTLRRKKIAPRKTMEQFVYEYIKSHVGNEKFLYNANVGFRDKVKGGTLAVSTHGINKYKEYTELVFMPSLNATSATVKLLTKFGMTRSEIDFARNVLTAYQFVSRGAVRDISNDKHVNLYVMDKRTAEFLKSVFKDASVIYHNLDVHLEETRKRKIPNNIKSFMSRIRKRLENGERVRDSSLEKYKNYLEEYYNGK